ncbi:MAG: alpha-galactosidase, partial [bacterium]
QLFYRLQIFPNSNFIRERLEIAPNGAESIALNKYKDQIRLVFPKYYFTVSEAENLKIQEVRLAEWEGEILSQIDWSLRPNDRLQLSGGKSGRNLSQNHMYHPKRIVTPGIQMGFAQEMKGPIGIILDSQKQAGIIVAYEHGSPDDDSTQNYLALGLELKETQTLKTSVQALKGAYLDGEEITASNPYATVWVDVGYFQGDTLDDGEAAFWKFLYFNQSEHLASRQPTFYYNTWGLQRDDQKEKKKRPQEILTEKRVLQEINYAHQLGVDVFVIDDGWQNYFGDWQPITHRFPDGFKKIKAKLDSFGIRLGLWFAAEGIDPNSSLYKNHPEWLVRNEDGTEAMGRWKKPIGCFSSGYKAYFTELCKYWIDQGVTYFKWDGLDKHLCYSPDHRHGDDSVSPQERAYRSGYAFILEVTDVAKTITEYNPDVVIVFDVTEESRNVGLAFLSEARFFWINNGATWYDDLSFYRAKSIRSVAHEFNQILPTVLQTSANYPHQSEMFGAQRYNVNTTLLGGGGFWGDLSEMSFDDRERVGEVVKLFKKVAPTVVATRPRVTGLIGSSPEIYEFINPEKAEGSVIAFSGSALQMVYKTQRVNQKNLFCVLRNAYALTEDGSIDLTFLFPQPDATCEAFVLSNSQFAARIASSTCWLKSAQVTGGNSITYVNGAPGHQQVIWPKHLGKPNVYSSDPSSIRIQIKSIGGDYRIVIAEMLAEISIQILSD